MSNRFVNPFPRFFDNAGALLNGGLLNFYENDGGTTRKDTYSDAELTVVNANPVVLTASGVVPDIFLNGEYRVVLTDEDGVQLDSAEDVNVDSFTVDDANNNGVTDVITMTHTTTGTPQAGIGTGLGFATETAAGNTETGMTLDAVTTDVTPGSEDFDFSVNLMSGGATAAEKFRVTSAGIGKIDTINELTTNSGVTIEGILLKDSIATAATFEPTGDTSAGDNAAFGYTAAEGAIITGQGSTNDVTIKNDADGIVAQIPTGTTTFDLPGTLTVDTINESTNSAGVTVEGVAFENGSITGITNIQFSGQQTLDSYREGTFTFGVEDGSANAVTLDNTTGYYTRIGRIIEVSIYIDASSLGSATGAIKLTGLPFIAATSGANQMTGLYSPYSINLNITAGYTVSAKIDAFTTEADLQIWDAATGTTDLTAAELSADGIILLTGTYWSDP